MQGSCSLAEVERKLLNHGYRTVSGLTQSVQHCLDSNRFVNLFVFFVVDYSPPTPFFFCFLLLKNSFVPCCD